MQSRTIVAALAALLILPLFVALVGFHRPTWTPVLDLAQTELRVRDVGTSNTPLIGLPGRILYDGQQGSHPGPLSFFALAPAYRLLGSTPFALQAGTVAVHAGAIVAALLIARRRGGRALMIGVAAALALLINGFGVTTLTEPWNPYLPLLWWVVVVLAVWSVVCGDIALLPVAVIAGSFCAQTHVPYLVLCLGAGALATAAAIVYFRRGDPAARRSILRWTGLSAAIGVLAWLPPIVDQLRHRPGNLSILLNYFTRTPSTEPVVGLRDATDFVLRHLDVFHLSVDQLAHPGLLVATDPHRNATAWRGAILLALWAGAAVVAVRARHQTLIRLHLVAAVGLGLVLLATSRIYGVVWYYLLLSTWTVTAVMTIATVWTAVVVLGPRFPRERGERMARAGVACLLAIAVMFSARSTWVAPSARHSDATVVRELSAVVPGTVAVLDRNARYLVAWDDAAFFGSPGYGLLNELDRRGFHVGAFDGIRVIVTPHRVLQPSDATARIQLATGQWVDAWRRVPGATEVAFVDPRTPAQQARFAQLRSEVIDRLRSISLGDLADLVDLNLFAVSIDTRVPDDVASRLAVMLELGVPMAVFIAPPGTHL
jgi:hypothetical protein